MNPIPESELILNEDGSIYHLHLLPEMLAETVIIVGDPERVTEVSKYFDTIEFKVAKREFITHTGYLNNKRLTVLSTGIGTDNIDIVFNELDACVNIDFKTRLPRSIKKSLDIVRIGTAGSLQADLEVDQTVVSTHGIGLDNLANYYFLENEIEETYLLEKFKKEVLSSNAASVPYIASGSTTLLQKINNHYQSGLTLTCPGFYGPQGRELRLAPRFPNLIKRAAAFSYEEHRITNFEMETAGIYALGRLLGHHCVSVSAIMANRIDHTFSKNPKKTIDRLIVDLLEKISHL